jgi:2-pyrone-4,6-dicarboxylate lactonase
LESFVHSSHVVCCRDPDGHHGYAADHRALPGSPFPPASCLVADLRARVPRNAWDGQVHVFGGPYPLSAARRYDPPAGSDLDGMLSMHERLGFARGVVVQGAAQGWETRYVVDVLRRLPHYAGVVLMGDHLSDRQLEDLHAAGVRGGRFVFLPGYEISTDPLTLERSLHRVAKMGWFAKIFATATHWPELRPYLDDLTIPAVIDHLGYIDPSAGPDQPAMRITLDLLKRDNWWMMLSCGDRITKVGDASDVVPFARTFIEAAPDRVIWGSDWPHVAHASAPQRTEVVLDLLFRYARDSADVERILVSNPARMFGR